MVRSRKFHFVIHNQGLYSQESKRILLDYLKTRYDLTDYLIAQETYTMDASDTHLQGNIFLKNPIHSTALLKHLQLRYKEERSEKGLLYRVDVKPILHEGKAFNYMTNSTKEGGDPTPLTSMTSSVRWKEYLPDYWEWTPENLNHNRAELLLKLESDLLRPRI